MINIIHKKLITIITFQNTSIQRQYQQYENHNGMKDWGSRHLDKTTVEFNAGLKRNET